MLNREASSAPVATTLIEQVMAEVRALIASRALAPGARLPSIRRLARSRGVSNATVVEAYERLVADGVIAARPGSGFYVTPKTRPLVLAEAVGPADRPTIRTADPLWIMRQSLEATDPSVGAVALLRPGCGWLPETWLPVDALRRGLRALARADDTALADYGTPLGFPPLRHQLARRLAERGVEASPRQILLTDSGTQALDLVFRLLVEPGDRVLVDDPCYFNFLGLARAHRARAVGVPLTPDGPDLAAFAKVAAEHRPRLYLTTAAFQNPTGASLKPAVAHQLLTLAKAHEITIVEDDIFGDLEPSSGPAAPRLAALGGLSSVIQVGSFSKTLSAALRCGHVAARPDWIEGLVDLKLATAFSGNDASARLVYHLLTDGSYRRHVEALRGQLARAMGDTARRLQALGLTLWTEPRGGLFLWAELPRGLDAGEVARRAREAGVVLAPGNAFSIGQRAARHLRFNVAQCGAKPVFDALASAMEAEGREQPVLNSGAS